MDSATAGSEFTTPSALTITIPAGETSENIVIAITDDQC